MKAESQPDEQAVQPFLGPWRTHAVEHLENARTESTGGLLPRLPVVAEEVGDLVGLREAALRGIIVSIHEDEATATTRHQTTAQRPIVQRDRLVDPDVAQPAHHAR